MPLPTDWKPSTLTDAARGMEEDRHIVESVPTFQQRLDAGKIDYDPIKYGGFNLPNYYGDESNRLMNVSLDPGGHRAYDQVMRGGRPAYEVTGDPNISPYWRNRAYNDTPVKTEAQRRRAQSLYGGHQQRQSFDSLDRNDPKHQAYMARKFKEAGVHSIDPSMMTEAAYQNARDEKASDYHARKMQRRKRVAESVRAPRRLGANEYNRNRRSTAGHLGADTSDAKRERRMRMMGQQLQDMFSSYSGY